MVSGFISVLVKLKMLSPQVKVDYLKKQQLMDDLEQADTIIAQMALLDKPFFYEPMRTSRPEVLGPSGLGKMKDKDNYRLALLKEKNSPVILDIGSHIGIFPRVAKAQFKDAKIYSLEPDKDNFRVLKLNNELLTDVKSYQYGVYEDKMAITLKASDKNSWRSSLAVNNTFFRQEVVGDDSFSFDEYEVQCLSIDQFVEQEKLSQLDLIGITVPGEIGLAVVKGMLKTLTKFKPIVSLSLYSSEVKDVVALFKAQGYEIKYSPIGSMHTFTAIESCDEV